MNFWELNDDDSRGYYFPAPDRAARDSSGWLISGLFFLIINLFKLAGSLLMGMAALLVMILRWIWKLVK